MKKKYSVVIPFKNEEENVGLVVQETADTMKSLDQPWELIVIDDGSTDKTLTSLIEMKSMFSEMKIIVFSQNAGQSSAFEAGFKAASGEFIITLDGDGQNDPRDIPLMIETSQQGYDLVVGRRANRKDSFSKKWISRISNFIRSKVCKDGISDTGCSLKLYRRSCLDQIKMYEGMHRFIPALFVIEGFSIKQIDVNHRPRFKGKSKYNFLNRSIHPLIDMFVVYWMRKRSLKYTIKTEL